MSTSHGSETGERARFGIHGVLALVLASGCGEGGDGRESTTVATLPPITVTAGMGNYDAVDPAGAALYIPAEDGQALVDAFDGIAGALCCGDSCPEG